MGIGVVRARDLDALVTECDRLGGLGTPATKSFLSDFRLSVETTVDQSLDPFSDEYFHQQVELYREISGRNLNQSEGEFSPVDVRTHTDSSNPYNSRDIRFIARNARAIHTCLLLADLPPGASVLDMGCGWGLSSEMIAFTGARVTAVDINALFVDLVRERALRLGLPIWAIRAEFDTFDSDEQFDLVFFYECLHHCLKPWDTLERLKNYLKPTGKIMWAGEPVNDFWWTNWGLRLDHDSVYCMRKFGWWESGWSAQFLIRCFARAGLAMTIIPEVGLDNGLVGFAVRNGDSERIRPDASIVGSDARLAELSREVARLHGHIAGIQSSLSWRMGAPIRRMGELAKRLRRMFRKK